MSYYTESGTARNKPCHCGSGIKYKKCCLVKGRAEIVAQDAEFRRQLVARWEDGQRSANPRTKQFSPMVAAIVTGALLSSIPQDV